MADEINLLFGIRLAQIVDDGHEVFQVLCDSQPSGIGRAVEGAPRAALINIGHQEVALEIAVEIAKERPLGTARPAMQPEEQWRTSLGPVDFYIQLSAADIDTPRDFDRVSTTLSAAPRCKGCASQHKDTNCQRQETREAPRPRIPLVGADPAVNGNLSHLLTLFAPLGYSPDLGDAHDRRRYGCPNDGVTE